MDGGCSASNICLSTCRWTGEESVWRHATTSSHVSTPCNAWAYGRDNPTPVLDRIRSLLGEVRVLTFEEDAAERFGMLQNQLLRQGITVSPVDLMIASVALVNDLTLVTHNTRDFENIPGLRLQDWLTP